MKNCSGPELLESYTTIHNLLSERGLAPKMHYIDNELEAFVFLGHEFLQDCWALVVDVVHFWC